MSHQSRFLHVENNQPAEKMKIRIPIALFATLLPLVGLAESKKAAKPNVVVVFVDYLTTALSGFVHNPLLPDKPL